MGILLLGAASQAPAGFNGGKTEMNFLNIEGPGQYAFINFIKGASEIQYLNPPTDPTSPKKPILELDADGYPTSLPAGTGGYFMGMTIPTATQYSGRWVLKWDGTGTSIPANFNATINSTAANRVEFTNNETTGNWTSCVIFVTATSASPNHLKNLRLCRKIDEALMDGGQFIFPDHLALMKSAKPGAIRSLGWGGAFDGTNTALIATWAQRRSRNYIQWGGTTFNPNFFGGTTTSSGLDYMLAYSGYALTDKSLVHLIFNADAPKISRFGLPWSTTSGVAININWTAHGLAAGNVVVFGNTPADPNLPPPGLTSAQFYFINNVIDANNFTVSATSGGSSVLATATSSGNMWINPISRININGTGFVPMTDFATLSPNNASANGQAPKAGLTTLIYDATTGWFHMPPGTNGLMCGGPPEVFIDYCAAIGSHPWLTAPFMSLTTQGLAGVTDFMPSWAAYVRDTYPWMKPIIEPYNETWNPTLAGLGTVYATGLGYILWPTKLLSDRLLDNVYGMWVSQLGQAMSTVFANDRTKYSMVCAVQGSTMHSTVSLNINDFRLTSKLYVSENGGSPAYLWTDRVSMACYYGAPQVDGVQEVIGGFNYSITNAGNPSAQSAIVEAFAASANNGVDTFATLAFIKTCFTNMKAWGLGLNGASAVPTAAGGNTVKGMVAYEGGWGPNVPINGDWSTSVSGSVGSITQANPCVLTLNTTSTRNNDGTSGLTGNPGVIGMAVSLSNVGGMLDVNNNLIKCTFTNGSASIAAIQKMTVNQQVSFTATPPAPFAANTTYHVIATGLSNTALQLSATEGGSAITTTAGGAGYLNSNNFIACSFTNGSASVASVQALLVNQAVSFPSAFGKPPTPFVVDTPYHVISTGLSNTAFQLSATKGGSAIVAGANQSSLTASISWFITAVGASTITLDLDSTAFSTWTSGGTVSWTGSGAYSDTLRIAALSTSAMGANNTQMYTDFYSLGGGGFTAEYPSNFLYFGNAGSWSVLNPNIYAPLTPQWNSIVAANA